MGDLLVRRARIVPLPGATSGPRAVDVLVRDGVVVRVAPTITGRSLEVLDAAGRFVVPGLWDAHTHLTQWALRRLRLDTSGAASAAELLDLVRRHVDGLPPGTVVQGFGHRRARWPDTWSRADLDAVAGHRPVVLVSGDAHHGLLSSAALRALGPLADDADATGALEEDAWFAAFARLDELLPLDGVEDAVAAAVRDANARGVVGVVDLEFASTHAAWLGRVGRGTDSLRVRAGCYPDELEQILVAGRRTGDVVAGLVRTGPLKIISDGSLGTRTAHCCDPYADAGDEWHGTQNTDPAELVRLLRRATVHGLDVAVHAIGDAAVRIALDAFEATGARGSIEHAQLVQPSDVPRMARLGVAASVQPAHLLDDRDTAERLWAGRTGRCFALRSLTDAGVRLALGSDAPVAPLDPWLAMAAAVHRSADDRPPWHDEQRLTAAETLAASVDGRRVAPGQPGDLVLLDDDPLAPATAAETADRLRATRPSATVVAGRVVHGG